MRTVMGLFSGLLFFVLTVGPSHAKFIGGTVESADPAALQLTIQNESGKSETLKVDKAELLSGLQKGDRVSIEMSDAGGVMAVTKTVPDKKKPLDQPVAAADQQSAAKSILEGELLKIENDFYYVVKDSSGKEVRLQVDQETKMDGSFQPGDKIVAQLKPDGHAAVLKKLSAPDTSSEKKSPASPGTEPPMGAAPSPSAPGAPSNVQP